MGVRPDVRQARLRALVRRRGDGGGRVLRGPRGPGRAREGLRGGRRRVGRGRGRGGGRGVLNVPSLLTLFSPSSLSDASSGVNWDVLTSRLHDNTRARGLVS